MSHPLTPIIIPNLSVDDPGMPPTSAQIPSQDAQIAGRAASTPPTRQIATDPGLSEGTTRASMLPAAQRILSETALTARPSSAQSQRESSEEPVRYTGARSGQKSIGHRSTDAFEWVSRA